MMHVAVDAAEVLLREMKRWRISRLLEVVLFGFVALAFFVDSHDDDDQLQVEIVSKPENCEGLTSQRGNVLKMHYTGWLLDGTKFDSSRDRGDPFTFELGAGQVIKGWDQGLIDMCVGEKRKLTIPPHLGYGDRGAGDKIPGGSTLLFDVELLQIQASNKPPQNIFKDIDSDKDNFLSQDEVSEYIKKQEGQQGVNAADENSHNSMIGEIFMHEDKDRDGFISYEEFSGPKHDEL